MAACTNFAFCSAADSGMNTEMWLPMGTIREVLVVGRRNTVSMKLDSIAVQRGICSTVNEAPWTNFGAPSI